jgi:threonine dehydratase
MKKPSLSLDDVLAASRRLAGGVRRTPVHEAPALAQTAGSRVWLKREDLQRTGSFKERGARHALLSLSPAERQRGVVAASAGNHALGLAFHGGGLGVNVTVVMPVNASPLKVARCRGLGAEVVLQGENFEAAERFAWDWAAERNATYVHPFDDLRVIAGQGTLALELIEQLPDLDMVVVPVGGGGLLAGVVTVVKTLRPDVRVVAVEPENAAGFLAACLRGAPAKTATLPTLADGLAVASVGRNAFALAGPHIDDVVTVSEEEIAAAVGHLARDHGIVAEGAGATAVAAWLSGKVGRANRVALPITGRNVDVRLHADVLARTIAPTSRTMPHAA